MIHNVSVHACAGVGELGPEARADAVAFAMIAADGMGSVRDAGGWPLAFGLLAAGPALGIVAMRRLASARSSSIHQPHPR